MTRSSLHISIGAILTMLSGCLSCPEGQEWNEEIELCIIPNTLVETDEPAPTPTPTPEPEPEESDPPLVDTDLPDPIDDSANPDTSFPFETDIICGQFTEVVAGECQCMSGYEWCSNPGGDCCEIPDPTPGLTSFEVTIVDATIASENSTGGTWDAWPYTAPDPYFVAALDGSTLYTSADPDDTYSPIWNEGFQVQMSPGDRLNLTFYDSDLSNDDTIQGFNLTFDDIYNALDGPEVSYTGSLVQTFSIRVR